MTFNKTVKPFVTEASLIKGGEILELCESNVKDRNTLIFTADIKSLSDDGNIAVGHGYKVTGGGWIEIGRKTVRAFNFYHFRQEPLCPVTEPISHGLIIEGHITVLIEKNTLGGDVARIITDSGEISIDVSGIAGNRGAVFSSVTDGALENCKLSWICSCYADPIWIFGDSYLSHTDDVRWPYYLYMDGYNQLLLSGYSGMATQYALPDFELALRRGVPEYAVWCLGMNNNDGESEEPSESWLNTTERFLAICDEKKITPILATIPSTPKINNKPKSKWVRESGRRFIDFERAVGADEELNWREGMLSEDLVHPAKRGAIALYARVLSDFPEICAAKKI